MKDTCILDGKGVVLMDPFKLIIEGKFKEAVEQCSTELETKLSSPTINTRGFAYLNLGDLDRALADFQKAEEVRYQALPDQTDAYQQEIGMVLWLKGQEQEAASIWYNLVQALTKGKIVFSDMAGGVQNGALLWFASCYEGLRNYYEPAKKFLEKKVKSPKIRHWPGPIAQYLLKNLSEEELIQAATCNESKILEDRQLCQANFYIGAKALANGDKKRFKESMLESVRTGKRSRIELEYYLAKYELERASV